MRRSFLLLCRLARRDVAPRPHDLNGFDKGDAQAAAAALRKVRYWRARRASAEVVRPSSDTRTVSFGMTVTLRREDGREQTFRIVGEDEADPSHGTVSYVSPLARAVLTYGPGDTVEIAGGKAVILDLR